MNINSIGLIIFLVIVLFILETVLGLWLWGVIAVGVFGLPALTFWKFVGLEILLYILFPSRINTTSIRGKK